MGGRDTGKHIRATKGHAKQEEYIKSKMTRGKVTKADQISERRRNK